MAIFTVWQLDSAEGADAALRALERLDAEDLIDIEDAACVRWPETAAMPATGRLDGLVGTSVVSDAFWGFFFGLIFFVPLLGMTRGAATGTLTGSLGDIGVDDAFVEDIRKTVRPGTSALFLLMASGLTNEVEATFERVRGHAALLHASVSADQERTLRRAFARDVAAVV